MTVQITPTGAICGARCTGVDLNKAVSADDLADIRAAWLKHRVLVFPEQWLSDDSLERFTIEMGGFGEDPFFEPIEGRQNIAAIIREQDETTPLFAENWHTDWSFLKIPPAGTCLTAISIPPKGGDTLFADQVAAFAALPEERKTYLRTLTAIHSARGAYAPDGTYGSGDKGRSMAITAHENAFATQFHPLIRTHPETGEEGFFSTAGYIIGIEGIDDDESLPLLLELMAWQTKDEFVYRHIWRPGMAVMWDNRSVLHKATGGYQGYRRELHRTTIAERVTNWGQDLNGLS